MIFADKLIQLRKKCGWSQEELAEQMNVTRQSVSKWEGAQSIPDLEKIIRLSELFGVSTDYLLKDEMEEEGPSPSEGSPSSRRVSMEEANAFLSAKAETSKTIARATFLCILSPICLFILGVMSEIPKYGLTEVAAGGIGMIVLLALVAAAVALFISSGNKTAPFGYLEKEAFETQYGVREMVQERKARYKDAYAKNNILGSCICIASLIPLFCGAMIDEDNELLLVAMLSVMLAMVGVGVVVFVRNGILWESFEKLLQEGEYSKARKERQPVLTAISTAYWLIATAVYLAYSFVTENWELSWIVWPVAGVVFPALIGVVNAFGRRRG